MQALIITAYHDMDTLKENLRIFSKNFNCYVHLDKKSNIATSENIEELNKMKGVTACSLYEINWGSYLHMMAIVELLRMAEKNEDNHFFHVISGDDFPIQGPKAFEDFFEREHRNENFLEVTDISEMPEMQKRYQIYHFLHVFNRRSKNPLVIYTDKILRNLQYVLHIRRKHTYQYKGLVWGSINRAAVRKILNEMEKPKFVRNLKYCEIAEEFIFQNVLMESEMKDSVVWDNLRFDIWEANSTGPRVMDIDDYEKIKALHNVFFIRKVVGNGTEKQRKLYDELKKNFLEGE